MVEGNRDKPCWMSLPGINRVLGKIRMVVEG